MPRTIKRPDAMHVGSRCIDKPETESEAAARAHRGRFSKTNKPLAAKADNKNYCAQLAVCQMLGQSIDLIPSKPTRGWDFQINGIKVKIMGAQENGNLAIKVRKTDSWYADVFILAWIVNGEPHVIRWCEKSDVLTAPTRVLKPGGDYEQRTHVVSYTSMHRDLHALKQRLGLAARQTGLF